MSRHGKIWTTKETDSMLAMVSENISIKEISEIMGRSAQSITIKLHRQIYLWFENENKSIDWIISKTPFDSIQYIQDIINNEKMKINNKQMQKIKKNEKREKKVKSTTKSDIEKIKKDISDIKLMLRGVMSILEEITVVE
jgi:hypothetical protein